MNFLASSSVGNGFADAELPIHDVPFQKYVVTRPGPW